MTKRRCGGRVGGMTEGTNKRNINRRRRQSNIRRKRRICGKGHQVKTECGIAKEGVNRRNQRNDRAKLGTEGRGTVQGAALKGGATRNETWSGGLECAAQGAKHTIASGAIKNQTQSNDREKANQVKCEERDRAIERLTHELSKLKEKEKEYKKDARQRLKPRQIQDFDGSQDNWIKWRCDTKATLHATGHRDIMESREAADNDHPLNSALWGTLLNACSGGSASSKVTRHEDASDGHAAWKELLEWYDSESQQEAYAATMKLKLEGVRLHPEYLPKRE
eukprot:jgi/Psemu1/53704/gm1.53704_g